MLFKMIEKDNKLFRTKNVGHKKIVKSKKQKEKRNSKMFSYDDYPNDFWFTPIEMTYKKEKFEPMPVSL